MMAASQDSWPSLALSPRSSGRCWRLCRRPRRSRRIHSRRKSSIKSTLLTFNDANVTGNYTVMHAKLSKPFRDQFSPEKLKEVFKVFHDKRIDFDLIVAKPPVARQPARVNDNGVLMLYGHFDTSPSQVHYELEFIMSDGEWRPIRINVQLKRP